MILIHSTILLHQEVRNNNWSEREKELLIEQCTKKYNVIHGTISCSVSEELIQRSAWIQKLIHLSAWIIFNPNFDQKNRSKKVDPKM